MESALKKYLEKTETSSLVNFQKSNNFPVKLFWNRLDIKKMNIFYFNFEIFLINEQDDCLNKITSKLILSELLKKRDSKACIKQT